MAQTEKFQPPYMSFGVFKSTIETLAETVVPSGPIDRRVLSGLSGADYGSLIPGLRFLGLIDEQRKATQAFRELVEASKDGAKFREKFLEILTGKYAPIIGHLNMKHGTAAELEKAFKDYGVAQGQMLTKSIRFFLKALTEGGATVSPYMTAPKPRTPRAPNGAGKKHERGRPKPQDDSPHDVEQEIPSGYERLPLPGVPNSFIQYPANLTEAHCQILEAMVGVLKTSVKARTGVKGATA